MSSSKSPPGSLARRGGRNISHPLPRRPTTGPLDSTEDPLAATSNVKENADVAEPVHTQSMPVHTVPKSQDTGVSTAFRALPVQLRFLQDPRLYHHIPVDEVPKAFLESTLQPPEDTTIPDLLNGGHFRRAAEVALTGLLSRSTNDAIRLLQLFYCRLACLTLIAQLELAADEAAPFLDFLTSNAADVIEVIALIPWQLRILLVRLQSVTAEDGGRRAIMTLYSLASEVREHIHDARSAADQASIELWSARLKDIGLRIADTLVEAGELETSNRHLDSLVNVNKDEVHYRKALLYIRSGDVARAQRFIKDISDTRRHTICEALLTVADVDASEALSAWHALTEQSKEDELAAQNKAVYLLYAGHTKEAVQMLENLVDAGKVFSTLLFNLSTIYELCSNDAQSDKFSIVEKLASSEASSRAWERSMIELKL